VKRIQNRIVERQGSLEELQVVVDRIAVRVHLVAEYNPLPCDQLKKENAMSVVWRKRIKGKTYLLHRFDR